MQRVLITGSRGFLGRYMQLRLEELGFQVFGYDKRVEIEKKNLFNGDITDKKALKNTVRRSQPELVFHLAGLIKSGQADAFYKTNLLGTINLFESLLETGQRPVVIVPSSSAVYGSGVGRQPISEGFRLRPITHYAVSKLAQESVALRYWNAFRLPVVVVRMFNLLGAGLSVDLACSAFARQIALGEKNGQTEIMTGNLSARRDFVDVRDAVRALGLVAEKGKAGQVYNICSGRAVAIRECLDEMICMSSHQFEVRIDAERFQENDIPVQVGSYRKLNQRTGWLPQISLRESLSDLLNDWRQRIKSELE